MNENVFTVSSVFQDAIAISKKSFFRIAGLFLLGMASYIPVIFIRVSAESAPKPIAAAISLSTILAIFVFQAVIYQAVIRVALKNLSLSEALLSSISDWKALTLISVLLTAISYGGMLFLFIPGFIFVFWYGFASFVFADERLTGMDALMRSKSYVVGRWWKVLGYLILAGLAALGAVVVAGLVFIINPIVGRFAIIASWAFVMVFLAAFNTSLYKAVSTSRAEVRSAPVASPHWFEKTALVVGIVIVIIGVLISSLSRDEKSQKPSDFNPNLLGEVGGLIN